MSPITVAQAGPIMAKAMGFDWVKDRTEVVEYLNKYRLLLFTEYEKFKLFDDVFHCICVESFNQACVNDSCEDSTYQGFSLPNDVLGVEAVWSYGLPLTLRTRWREAHMGIGVANLGRVEAVMMAEVFATERDMDSVTKIKLYAEHEEDDKKDAYLEVIDASGRQKRIRFCLVGNGFAVSPVRVRKILSVSLPSNLRGGILLSQTNNRELSWYAPWETVPTYRRMKVAASSCPSTVLVQGTKKFHPVYFDHDIVEVGNQLIIEAAGRFFKYGEATTEAKEINRAQLDRLEMERLLKSEQSRHRGRAVQDNSPFRGRKNTANKTLSGYHKR